MGFYIQPNDLDQPLLSWLQEHGHPVSETALKGFVFVDTEYVTVPVCWVDNGGFQAAGIAFDYMELKRFLMGTGARPHKWFLVPKDLIRPWLPRGNLRGTS